MVVRSRARWRIRTFVVHISHPVAVRILWLWQAAVCANGCAGRGVGALIDAVRYAVAIGVGTAGRRGTSRGSPGSGNAMKKSA